MSKEQDSEVTVFVDFLPNLVKLGQMKTVEDILRKRCEASLPSKIVRYGRLPYLIVKLGPFQPFINETR